MRSGYVLCETMKQFACDYKRELPEAPISKLKAPEKRQALMPRLVRFNAQESDWIDGSQRDLLQACWNETELSRSQ